LRLKVELKSVIEIDFEKEEMAGRREWGNRFYGSLMPKPLIR
jgi:hypothetical protein